MIINLELNEVEAQNLVQLIEAAIRSVGSQASRPGVPLQDKIAAATVAAHQQAEAAKKPTENAGPKPEQP